MGKRLLKTREERRNRLKLEKEKSKKFFKEIWHLDEFAEDDKRVGKRASTRVPCSCYMCGNPRHNPFSKKKDKITMQEKIANLDDYE